jgi:hypothetical protein
MIRLPQRSVTRFFIPLIDVLTLLFCIFLVLPLADPSAEADPASEERLRSLEQEVQQLRQARGEVPERLRAELERLRKEKGKALEKRLAVRVLEIDTETGQLFYRDPDRLQIDDEAVARTLIDHDRRMLGVSPRELYYLILYPRDPHSSKPTRKQREQYDRWFSGVALGYDIPGRGVGGGPP